MDQAFEKLRALKVQFVSTGPQTLPPSIQSRCRNQGVLFSRSGSAQLGNHLFSAWQRRPALAGENRQVISRHRSHCHRDLEHRCEFEILSRSSRTAQSGRERKFRNRTGTFEPGIRSASAHHRDAGDAGPGIEFLEYLTPRDGRPRPHDVHANDIVHWQTIIVTDDLDLVAKRLRDSHAAFVSSGIIQMPKGSTGFSKGLLVSDPDGHDVLLIQK